MFLEISQYSQENIKLQDKPTGLHKTLQKFIFYWN